MKRTAIALAIASCFGAAVTLVPDDGRAEALARVTNAADVLLASLDDEQRKQASFPFENAERKNWNFVPREYPGVAIRDLSLAQRAHVHSLLRAALSSKGYLKVTSIMALEGILRELESRPDRPATHRDPERYWIAVFGTPRPNAVWGWRLQGHHVSLNWTTIDDEFAPTPMFLGANPHQVRQGPRAGLRVLGEEEDLARALMNTLTPEQAQFVVLAVEAPRDVILGPGRKADLLGEPKGLPAVLMTAQQKAMLLAIIREYAENLRGEFASVELERIRDAGIDGVRFAWAGSTDPKEPHYYRVHGRGFVIEYDNTQGGANHSHTVWHDLHNGFGEDALRRHYAEGHGQQGK